MSTQNVERELRAVLDRHAEDAMDSTDTQAERERFYEVLEAEPRNDRRRWVFAVAAAAAAVTAVAVLSTVPRDDDTAPPPTNNKSVEQLEREAELLADQVAAAYADHDGAAVASYLASGESSWPELMHGIDRDRAWRVEYLVRPCEAKTKTSIGIVVECPTDTHLMYSEEVGVGPFRGLVFSVLVHQGAVVSGQRPTPWIGNGMQEYMANVARWINERHPEDAAFLGLDATVPPAVQWAPEVPAAQWERWIRLWEKYTREYADAMTSGGNG